MGKNSIHNIIDAVAKDPSNQQFTQQGWKPIFRISKNAKILIIGQAPGIKTQLVGDVFHDQSGKRLRDWMGVNEEVFYESGLIAVLPMDFYFPGHGKSGDLPPRKDFAKKWHPQCLALMPNLELIILIGKYAQDAYLGEKASRKITENVLNYEQFLPTYFPLIHPSPRNQIWISKHPEFEKKILPALRTKVKTILMM